MPKTTATESRIESDKDLYAAMRFADSMVSLLHDFIPKNARREARDRLIEISMQEGFELTSKAMRKEYEAWKSTQIEGLLNIS